MKLNARKDVPVNETWDLSLIFAAEADFEAAVEKAKALANIGKRLCFLITHVTQGEYRGLLFLSNFVQGQKNHSTRQFLKRIQLFWITRPDNPYQAF